VSEDYSIPLIQIYQKTSNKSNCIVLLERYVALLTILKRKEKV